MRLAALGAKPLLIRVAFDGFKLNAVAAAAAVNGHHLPIDQMVTCIEKEYSGHARAANSCGGRSMGRLLHRGKAEGVFAVTVLRPRSRGSELCSRR